MIPFGYMLNPSQMSRKYFADFQYTSPLCHAQTILKNPFFSFFKHSFFWLLFLVTNDVQKPKVVFPNHTLMSSRELSARDSSWSFCVLYKFLQANLRYFLMYLGPLSFSLFSSRSYHNYIIVMTKLHLTFDFVSRQGWREKVDKT